jgi:hypothetical protein
MVGPRWDDRHGQTRCAGLAIRMDNNLEGQAGASEAPANAAHLPGCETRRPRHNLVGGDGPRRRQWSEKAPLGPRC